MLATLSKREKFWITLQQPVCNSNHSTNTLRFLSALDNEWKIITVQLKPTWDQSGFVYRILLSDKTNRKIEEFILPRTKENEVILERYDLLPCAK